jgi:hypothetical protein
MEQSSKNENRINNENGCEIMDDMMEKITKEPYERPFENHDNLQTEISVYLKRKNEIMKYNLKKLHAQRNKWKNHNINAISWAFYCINKNKELIVKIPQIMICTLCYNNPVLKSNIKIQTRKDLILYNTSNGIIVLKKHVLSYFCHVFSIHMFKFHIKCCTLLM